MARSCSLQRLSQWMLKIAKYNLCNLFLSMTLLVLLLSNCVCEWMCVWKCSLDFFQKKKQKSYITLHFINLTTRMLSVISVSVKHCFTTDWFDESWLDNGFSSVCCYSFWPYSSWLLRCLNIYKQKLSSKPVTRFSGFMDIDHCTSGWVVSAEFIMSLHL